MDYYAWAVYKQHKMVEGSRIVDFIKEVKLAKRAVERAIIIYVPDIIDSILDKTIMKKNVQPN